MSFLDGPATPQSGQPDGPRLREVAKAIMRRAGTRRPHPADPESRRNAFFSMCCVCTWQREFENKGTASEKALNHGRSAHGDPFLGFVRVQCR